MNKLTKYIILFIFLILLQEFIFNNIQFSSFLVPYVYILLILLLPLPLHPSWVLVIAFILGLTMDIVSGGIIGAHAAACTVMAYARKTLIKFTLTKGEYEHISTMSSLQMGIKRFALYSFALVLVHHSVLFFIEVFSFSDIFSTILRIIISAIISTIFISLLQILISPKNIRA